MIFELADIISSRDGNILTLTYQRTLFPAPATKENIHQSQKAKGRATTDISRGSIEGYPVRMTSTPRKCCLERTTLRSLRATIRGRCDDFSMDQEERAMFEYPPATCHLPDNVSVSGRQYRR